MNTIQAAWDTAEVRDLALVATYAETLGSTLMVGRDNAGEATVKVGAAGWVPLRDAAERIRENGVPCSLV